MLKITNKNNAIRLCVFIAFLVCAIALWHCKNATANYIIDSGKNADGLTYGSDINAHDYTEAPDLIAVEATNGKTGYVYKSELAKAEGDNITNPEEAAVYMEEKNSKRILAFSDSLNKQTGQKVSVTLDQCNEAMALFKENKMNASEILKSLGIKNEASQTNGEEVLKKAIAAAQKANITAINVYEKDGKTKIGLFEVE